MMNVANASLSSSFSCMVGVVLALTAHVVQLPGAMGQVVTIDIDGSLEDQPAPNMLQLFRNAASIDEPSTGLLGGFDTDKVCGPNVRNHQCANW